MFSVREALHPDSNCSVITHEIGPIVETVRNEVHSSQRVHTAEENHRFPRKGIFKKILLRLVTALRWGEIDDEGYVAIDVQVGYAIDFVWIGMENQTQMIMIITIQNYMLLCKRGFYGGATSVL